MTVGAVIGAATGPGMPEPLEAGRDKAGSSLEPLEGGWPCRHLDFRLQASKAVRE